MGLGYHSNSSCFVLEIHDNVPWWCCDTTRHFIWDYDHTYAKLTNTICLENDILKELFVYYCYHSNRYQVDFDINRYTGEAHHIEH